MNIIDFIPFGKDKGVTRDQLKMLTGFTDRAVREAISQARRNTPILNNQDGKGYYRPLPEDKPLVEAFKRQETRRAKSIFYSMKGANDFLKG